MNIFENENNVVIEGLKNFSLEQTLDCGQAFRWSPEDNGAWSGIANGRFLRLSMHGDTLTLHDMTLDEFNGFWRRYFDIDRDYAAVIASCKDTELLNHAADYGKGIRILSQEPWEALCSFIISQNNNIPRIKGIIERLCESFGKKTPDGYAFPDAAVLAPLTVDDLSPLRSGFRAKYILDAARKVSSGEIDLEALRDLDYEQAREKLMLIKGGGGKVADCTLLFGLGHIEAFPRDVWIKRVMAAHFPEGLPESALPHAGIIQQYLFYYARTGKLDC